MLTVLKRILLKMQQTTFSYLEQIKKMQEQHQSALDAAEARNRLTASAPNKPLAPVQEEPQKEDNDLLGTLITTLQDQSALDKMVQDAPALPSPTVAPKTVEGPIPAVTVVGPSVVAPKSANTTVLAPSLPTSTSPAGASALHPDVVKKYTSQYKVPSSKVTEAILKAAQTTGIAPDSLFKLARAESNFDPVVKAGTSSATGLFQFIDSTWKYVMNDLGGKADFGLKGNKKDPYENAVAASIYMNHIRQTLAPARKNGEFTTGDLYLGHFAGPVVARNVIKALDQGKLNASPTDYFTKSQIAANKNIFYVLDKNQKPIRMRTLGEATDLLKKKVS